MTSNNAFFDVLIGVLRRPSHLFNELASKLVEEKGGEKAQRVRELSDFLENKDNKLEQFQKDFEAALQQLASSEEKGGIGFIVKFDKEYPSDNFTVEERADHLEHILKGGQREQFDLLKDHTFDAITPFFEKDGWLSNVQSNVPAMVAALVAANQLFNRYMQS